MRIVSLETFLQMPEGTLFRKWKPDYFLEPLVFHGRVSPEGQGNLDFRDSPLMGEPADDIADRRELIQLKFGDQACGRDGLHEDEQLFAIYSDGEIDEMIKLLRRSKRYPLWPEKLPKLCDRDCQDWSQNTIWAAIRNYFRLLGLSYDGLPTTDIAYFEMTNEFAIQYRKRAGLPESLPRPMRPDDPVCDRTANDFVYWNFIQPIEEDYLRE